MKFNKKGKFIYLILLGWAIFWVITAISLTTGVRAQAPTNLIAGSAYVDLVLGSKEKVANRSISGGYNVGFNFPCSGQKCGHIEVIGNSAINGRQWISGDDQFVSGGSGCLSGANGGKEPTGRHPYGNQFKVVLRNLNEQADTVDVWRYDRVCNLCGCTPYSIPTGKLETWKVGQQVFIGL